jgi:hypothetical protein
MEPHACHMSVIDLQVLSFESFACILSVVVAMVRGSVTTVVSC